MPTEDEQRRAEKLALDAGGKLPVGFVPDKWGGYWQCASEFGPYTFRLKENDLNRNDRPALDEQG